MSTEMDWKVTRDSRPCLRKLGLPAVVVVAAKFCPLFDMPVKQRYHRDTDFPLEKRQYCLTQALVAVGPLLGFDQAELHRKCVCHGLLL